MSCSGVPFDETAAETGSRKRTRLCRVLSSQTERLEELERETGCRFYSRDSSSGPRERQQFPEPGERKKQCATLVPRVREEELMLDAVLMLDAS